MEPLKTHNDNLFTFQKYYEANVSKLTLFARRFVAEETAEDIIHDLFLDVWRHFQAEQKLPNTSYLFTAIRNKCLNVITKDQVKRNYIQTIEQENISLGLNYYDSHEKLMISQQNIQQVYDAIDRLPQRCKQTFKLSYLEEKSNLEIAEMLDISIRTVEHHLYLGLKSLRSILLENNKD